MIPTARDLLAGAAVFLGQRYGVDVPTATVIAAAHAEAIHRARYRRGGRARCDLLRFLSPSAGAPAGLERSPDLDALNQARALGLDVKCSREELRALRVSIATRQVTFDDVRARFRAWTE